MTPQHASQSHGQVRRDGVETTAADTEQQISAGTSSAEQASDVLDEIDSVIETNAAAFVQGFVQKGGQ